MKNRLSGITGSQGFKASSLVLLTLMMLIPVSMVKSLIFERSYRAIEVKEEISSSSGGELNFAGPVLKIPGTRKVERTFLSSEGRKTSEFFDEEFSLWFTSEELDVRVELDTENKYRGIFYTAVFTGTVRLSGSFSLSNLDEDLEANEELHLQQAEIIIPFFNQKGIRGISEAKWNNSDVILKPGNRGLTVSSGGIYSEARLDPENSSSVDFSFEILTAGAEGINILPLAASSTIKVSANWPSPSFRGFCLPAEHDNSDNGFTAVWNTSSLSSGLPVKWDNNRVFDEYRLFESGITADLLNIHDHYEQNERAAKYAVLFILIPFITLFLFEHFFKRQIHIIQYILAGIANIIFYLLLLSLSEHISFNLSYLISSGAVTIMLCLYTFSMLRGDKKALLMGPVMIAAYMFLFITLQSEDWSLLIGSAGVFAVTGFIMFITRKIDFFQSKQNMK
jgi:inner membrane protein